tara:strand:- start:19 stop:309 length:291 start_codon:yes stop_codon:yes gene_type:complete
MYRLAVQSAIYATIGSTSLKYEKCESATAMRRAEHYGLRMKPKLQFLASRRQLFGEFEGRGNRHGILFLYFQITARSSHWQFSWDLCSFQIIVVVS